MYTVRDDTGMTSDGTIHMTSDGSIDRHNLLAPVSSFVGRDQELQEIRHRLTEHRLLTLTGAGGTGKSRLALQAATTERGRVAAGVWLGWDCSPLSTTFLLRSITCCRW